MNTPLSHAFVKCAALLTAFVCCAAAPAEQSTNAAPKITAPALIKSVFLADAHIGKDPFFPNSTRRSEALEQGGSTNLAPQPSALFNQLVLKGISL